MLGDEPARVTAVRKLGDQPRVAEELDLFAMGASHDLRGPLRNIRRYAQELAERNRQALDEEGQEAVDRITVLADRASELLDSLVTYTRLGAGENPREPVLLLDVVQRALGDLEELIEEHGADVAVDVAVDVAPGVRVMGHPDQLYQVVVNLLSNAIKFHEPDVTPTVQVAAWHQGPWVELTVTDDGIGMEAEHVAEIFEPFKRLHPTAEYPGTGLGLAICKRIVEKDGGEIRVETAPGKGSSFLVRLPGAPSAAAGSS